MPLPGPTLLPGPGLLPGVPTAAPLLNWIPDLPDVAIHIMARTVERATNNFLGTFSDQTRPTDPQAERAIATAEDDVLTETGLIDAAWLSAEGAGAVKSLIALRAAMIIERSYYPEQIGTNKSMYTALERDWDRRLPLVVAAIAEDKAGDIEPTGGVATASTDKDFVLRPFNRLWSHTSGWIGSGNAQSTFPDEAPGGTIRGDMKF